jgi:phosphoribosylaminoimidazolecarboxamide formyltransferase/IMP cyclohydrolase
MNHNWTEIKRALISVSDKGQLETIAESLKQKDVQIFSSGGTAKFLQEKGYEVTPVTEITGNPEAFGGRMKTISFQIGSALLFRRDHERDQKDAKELGIDPIDLVICNLYPFSEKVKENADDATLIENIDIGGPTMVRAAAKNFNHVTILTHPAQYDAFLSEFNENQGKTCLETRRNFAIDAFRLTNDYDRAVSEELMIRFQSQKISLRYGENSHQNAYFYPEASTYPRLAQAQVIQGKALSYNNLLDADSAWKVASDLVHIKEKFDQHKDSHGVVIVKHLNPCGTAIAADQLNALDLAWQGDPVSAFGSVIAFNTKLTKESAIWLSDKFVEIVIAPDLEEGVEEILAAKKNMRVLICPNKNLNDKETTRRSIAGGVLVQDEDEGLDPEVQTMSKTALKDGQEDLVHFGIQVNKYLKSNAVSLVGQMPNGALVLAGAGMGQPNRIDSLKRLAVPRALEKEETLGLKIKDLVLISDAFFPFADSIEACHDCGITQVIQPGGSIRDKEVIEACDRFGIAMAFTGRRHFRH